MANAIATNSIYKGEVDVYFERGDLSIHISKLPIAGIEYAEYSNKTGEFELIVGEESSGYEKATGNKNNHLVTIKDYYPDGKINEIRQLYSENFPENNLHFDAFRNSKAQYVEFPVGQRLIFDRDGKLTGTIDYNLLFKFKYADVKKLLKQKKASLKDAQISGSAEQNGLVRWFIGYHTKNEGQCSMLIDAKTGQIIHEEHHLENRLKRPVV